MYLETLESFMAQAEDLYRANPTRWVLTSTDVRPCAPTLSLALRFARSLVRSFARSLVRSFARCRYTLKYRDSDGTLIAKMTDDATCLKYKTDRQADLKKLEGLHDTLFDLMSDLDVDVEMR